MTPSVLIVGAGPVGMTLASELTRYGVEVRIVDQAPSRTDKSKAMNARASSHGYTSGIISHPREKAGAFVRLCADSSGVLN